MNQPNPTEGELAILRVLWSRVEPMTVREVHEALSQNKDTAYTTVLKMLTIMSEKGLARRDESERSHTYAASYSEQTVQSSMLSDFVQRAFSGSAVKLVQSALGNELTSQKELDEIAKLIANAKAKKKR
jgi:BlaI family transcriptional regulator, penicillinase repressor